MSFVGLLLMWSVMQHPEVTAAARARQPAGYTHAWGSSFGTAFNDEGRGIAVTNDGSVIHTSTSLNYTDESQNFPMAHVRKIVDGAVCWSLTYFVGAVGVDWVATRALALADPSTEQSQAPGREAIAYGAGLYRGQVSFGAMAPAPTQDSTFVARIRETGACPHGSAETSWVVAFTPTNTHDGNRNSALAIAAARQARHCADDLHSAPRTDVHGTIVVGGLVGANVFAEYHPFLWDPVRARRNLHDILDALAVNRQGWVIDGVNDLNHDGTLMTGLARRGDERRAFLVRLPPWCWADCTGDDVVDFNDLLCFLQRFERAQDPRANPIDFFYCDVAPDDEIDFNDFLAFLNLYNKGCGQ